MTWVIFLEHATPRNGVSHGETNPFKQQRLDFFLISDSLQELDVDSLIILSVQSDHSAIVLILSPTNQSSDILQKEEKMKAKEEFSTNFLLEIQILFQI